MCLLVEYREYRAWGGFADYKDYLDAWRTKQWPEGYWTDDSVARNWRPA